MTTIFGIQYLRAVAALGVVVFHAAERTGFHFAIGSAGVDVFFVVSGFIMWVISARRPMSPLTFLRDRIQRIAPIYWLATAVMVLGGIAGLFPNLILSIGHVSGSFLFIPMRSPSNGEIWPVLVQGWTLNYEMFFYAVFAMTLLLPRSRRLFAMTTGFLMLVTVGQVFGSDNALFQTYTRPILLEFVAGMIVAELWLRGRVPGTGFGLVLIAAAVTGFTALAVLGLPFDELVLGPLAVMLMIGTLALEPGGWFRPRGLAVLLGDASYSIYLWHTFAISVVVKACALVGVGPLPSALLAAASGTALGVCAYWLVEKPLTQRLRSGLFSNPVQRPA
ncbi:MULTISPECIES: acyltransferase [unclassified Ensifer]|uniref:acyltransferase family protein n=1 Tax=unclassified Ensifer TaxID=2633371 RepID=UPI00081342FC|nr:MULTISPECIES: acyltransferase [unclassified Ensifer]OCP03397.1 exopolysaccharide biosynthesis protein [Ensifer sp. LC14]OCP03729.1 exopolysaccharide biosynthesis protein [Ensifer sp. LC11]OCP03878.1 exopolysaccharide biosynthesis protein [Ensifer sp. LC13]OCP30292.1 exopolysaccharide biosynthesis protein [Ensifer sp. LC499]